MGRAEPGSPAHGVPVGQGSETPPLGRDPEAPCADQAIGRLSGLALKAADGIARLAKEAESESVQLRAWRAILADQVAIAKFSNLEQRLLEIEEILDERNLGEDCAG